MPSSRSSPNPRTDVDYGCAVDPAWTSASVSDFRIGEVDILATMAMVISCCGCSTPRPAFSRL